MEENKQLTQLLERMERSSRRQETYALWQCIFSAAAAVFCAAALFLLLILLPKIGAITLQANAVMTDIQQVTSQLAQADWSGVVANLEQVTGQMAQADLGSIVQEVNGLVRSSQEGLEQTIGKLNSINFETLNKAIEDLSKVVEPLANFFSTFR